MSIKNILFSVSFILLLVNMAVAQDGKKDDKPKKVRLKLEYLKLTDGTKVLKSKLYWKDGKNFMPVVDQDVTMTAMGDTSELKLGTIKTDEGGFATLYIEKGVQFPMNELGFTNFTAKMKKSDKYKRAKKSIDIKDAKLNFELDEKDSVRTVNIRLTSLNNEGETVPVNRSEISVYVKRLYSLLKVDGGLTDENGQYKVNFPLDIPGDSVGNLTIIVKVLESDEYGTIEKVQDIQWGTVVSYDDDFAKRALWGVEAPVWMIIAILVILAGAWFNFGLAIYKVSKIRKADEQPA